MKLNEIGFPVLHRHKEFGMVTSSIPWKAMTQEKSKSKYKRNFSLLQAIPREKTTLAKSKISIKQKILNKKAIQIEINSPTNSNNTSIDKYQQIAIKNMHNYSEDEDYISNRSRINSTYLHLNDLEQSESINTRNSINKGLLNKSRLDARITNSFIRSNLKIIVPKKLNRSAYSLSKLNLKFSNILNS